MAILDTSLCIAASGLAPIAPRVDPASTQDQSHRDFPGMRKKNDVPAAQGAGDLVRRAIRALRHGGMKNEHAMPFLARRFGLPARRVRALLYGEPVRLGVDEAVAITRGFERLMGERLGVLRAEIAAEEAALQEVDRKCVEVSAMLRAASEAGR